jgi:hypothetical protein
MLIGLHVLLRVNAGILGWTAFILLNAVFMGLTARTLVKKALKKRTNHQQRNKKSGHAENGKLAAGANEPLQFAKLARNKVFDLTPEWIPITNAANRADLILRQAAQKLDAVQGIYLGKTGEELQIMAAYAFKVMDAVAGKISLNEGFFSVVANTRKPLVIENVPGGLFQPFSGLGFSGRAFLVLIPLLDESEIRGVLELATFRKPGALEMEWAEWLSGNLLGTAAKSEIAPLKAAV